MSITILDELPFPKNKSSVTQVGNDLKVIYELSAGPPSSLPRHECPLPDPAAGPRLYARDNQILMWISLAHQVPGKSAATNDRCFPAIFDPGCDATLVISEWHLEHWATSPTFDPRRCRVQWFVEETVANSPAHPGPTTRLPVDLQNLIGMPLGVVLRDAAFVGFGGSFLPRVEADIWLPRNQKNERDYVDSLPPSHLLEVGAVLCRPGTSRRPPLFGTRAFTYGSLIEHDFQTGQTKRYSGKPTAIINYERCCLTLEYR